MSLVAETVWSNTHEHPLALKIPRLEPVAKSHRPVGTPVLLCKLSFAPGGYMRGVGLQPREGALLTVRSRPRAPPSCLLPPPLGLLESTPMASSGVPSALIQGSVEESKLILVSENVACSADMSQKWTVTGDPSAQM